MTTRSTFHILVLLVVLLTFSSRSVFGRGPRPTEREVETKQSAVLLIGDHQGIDETDMQQVVLLVVQALRQQGISVSESAHEAPASANVYRVVLRRSDEKILFRLSQEDSAGTTVIEREVLLENIKKMDLVASRLVYAIVHRKPFRSVWVPIKAGGFTAIAPIRKVQASGAEIGISFDNLSYAFELEGRFSRKNTDYQNNRKDYFHFYALSFGGRYFFLKRHISPYVGGGIGMIFTKYETTLRRHEAPEDDWEGFLEALFGESYDYDVHAEEAEGVGIYGVLGVEFLRFFPGQLKFELRVDRPFFKLPNQDVMPITVGITGGFSF